MLSLRVYIAVSVAVLWYCYKLPSNYAAARKTGLPIFICFVTPTNPIWLALGTILQPWLARYLPAILYDRVKACIYGWQFRERWALQARLGPSFCLVTPGSMEIWTADPKAAHEILSRQTKDFVHTAMGAHMMSIFGRNLVSTEGDEWARHRKIVAPALNERIMPAVWDAARSQARQMMAFFSAEGEREVVETQHAFEGIRNLALNVMVCVAYGERAPWSLTASAEAAPAGHALSFVETMFTVAQVTNMMAMAHFAADTLLRAFLPAGLRKLGHAKKEFPAYVGEMIARERNGASKAPNTLIGALVRAADDTSLATNKKTYLTESEIVGDMFNITIAGFDTTASAVGYAFLAFALFPEWQDWVLEELRALPPCPDDEVYQRHFGWMVRCMAMMNETMRFYSPIMHFARRAHGPATAPFPMAHDANIAITPACLHVSPDVYGPDALTFRPTRWIARADSNGGDGGGSSGSLGQETLVEPARGTFLPFSGGPRVCPGRKMAQVEWVATVHEVLSRWRIEPAMPHGAKGTSARASELLEAAVADSQPQIALQPRRLDQTWLRFVRR